MKKKLLIKTGTSAAVSFALLKALRNTADPYTRIAIGSIIGLGTLAIGGSDLKAIGIGVGIGSFLQGYEVFNGGRITKNQYSKEIFVLTENKKIIEFPAFATPDFNCDGYTYKGLNGVFKICDGVHCEINSDGKASFSGIGGAVNEIKNGGFKNFEWCQKEGNAWLELYNKSI